MTVKRVASHKTARCDGSMHGSERVLAAQPRERAELASGAGLVGCRGDNALDVLCELGGVSGFARAVTCGFAIYLSRFGPGFALADLGFSGHAKHSAAVAHEADLLVHGHGVVALRLAEHDVEAVEAERPDPTEPIGDCCHATRINRPLTTRELARMMREHDCGSSLQPAERLDSLNEARRNRVVSVDIDARPAAQRIEHNETPSVLAHVSLEATLKRRELDCLRRVSVAIDREQPDRVPGEGQHDDLCGTSCALIRAETEHAGYIKHAAMHLLQVLFAQREEHAASPRFPCDVVVPKPRPACHNAHGERDERVRLAGAALGCKQSGFAERQEAIAFA